MRLVVERTWFNVEVTRRQREAKRLQDRERIIATQLQEALLPHLPETMPGLQIRGFYRAALLEAGVGGDFTDCFSCSEQTRTCIVVADVSGKGLAAATQVAAVRNMLRLVIDTTDSVAAAVQLLNRTLLRQSLIVGFATMFVGIYDSNLQTLTYVNCGQEPGLVWHRQTQMITQLGPTASVLGAFEYDQVEQSVVALSSGDIFALFTDGFTEVGFDRENLIGINGISQVVADACSSQNAAAGDIVPAQYVVDSLFKSVRDFAGGESNLVDDLALIVGQLL